MLVGVDQSEASLDGARLDHARLDDVQLTGASLREVVWRDVIVVRGDLSGAVFAGATFSRMHVRQTRARGVVMAESNVRDALFAECLLNDANFRGSRFERCVFTSCNLVDADFTGAQLERVAFEDCDLSRAVPRGQGRPNLPRRLHGGGTARRLRPPRLGGQR